MSQEQKKIDLTEKFKEKSKRHLRVHDIFKPRSPKKIPEDARPNNERKPDDEGPKAPPNTPPNTARPGNGK